MVWQPDGNLAELETNQSRKTIRNYVKQLIAFRTEHPVLHRPESIMSRINLLVSRHIDGIDANIGGSRLPQLQPRIGCAVNQPYRAKPDVELPDDYASFNVLWKRNSLWYMPTLPAGKEWHAAIETFDETFHVLPQTAVKRPREARIQNWASSVQPSFHRVLLLYSQPLAV